MSKGPKTCNKQSALDFCECEDCKPVNIEERIEQQRNHYLYKRSEELDAVAKEQQIVKGAEKYPEPLEPDSWTALQGAEHAFQELHDLKQYVTLQLIKNERLEARVKELEDENKRLIEGMRRSITKAFSYGR